MSYDLDENVTRNDIQAYLKMQFTELSSHTVPQLWEEWPPVEQLNKLLDHCGSSFAYARTAARFIGASDKGVRDPRSQIRKILEMTRNESQHAVDSTSRYINLDKLYLGILQQAATKSPDNGHVEHLRDVISTIACLRHALRVTCLAEFLSVAVGDILSALQHVHSVEVVQVMMVIVIMIR